MHFETDRQILDLVRKAVEDLPIIKYLSIHSVKRLPSCVY